MINNDPHFGNLLRLVFIPNYGGSVAEIIILRDDSSEKSSTAAAEASGTANMKLSLNGALTIDTDDGANIEIRQNVGDEIIFIVGLLTPEVLAMKQSGYQPMRLVENNPMLITVINAINLSAFSPYEPSCCQGLVDSLLWGGDHDMLPADHDAYVATRLRVDALCLQPSGEGCQGHHQRGGNGRVFVRPNHPAICDANMERGREDRLKNTTFVDRKKATRRWLFRPAQDSLISSKPLSFHLCRCTKSSTGF